MAFSGEVLAAFSVLILTIWIYFKQNKTSRNILNKLPTPPGLPIIGNALEIRKTTTLLDVLLNYVKNYGGVIRLKVGPFRDLVAISDYKILEGVLNSPKFNDKSNDYRYLSSWLGSGLLTSTGTKWKKHRRIITPTFHFQILEQFIDVFENCGKILVEKLRKFDGDKSVDIYPLVTLCTLDIICETAMGTSINAQGDADSDYVFSVKDMCRILMERTVSIIESNDFLFTFTPNYRAETKALKIIHDLTDSVIVNRAELLKNSTKQGEKTEEDFGVKKKKVFLDMLLEATVDGRPLTHEEIREEVDTFMFEGHDTTASAISFILYNIAIHPEVQKLVYEEQVSLFGAESVKNPTVTYNDLQSMKYLELVIKESLRLYPSVPLFARKIDEPIQIDDVTLPANTSLIISAFVIQRSAEYFKDPDTFNPNRFEEEVDGKQPFAYIPFSAGPRNCVGQKFAMLEMKSTVSKVIRNLELSPAFPHHKLTLASETVLKSANGIKVGVKARK